MIVKTKYGEIKIFAKTLEEQAYSQIVQIANSPLGENANMRIMPDAHAGAGCVIGTTMIITDKVCSDIVGVDIGCGVDLVSTDLEFSDILSELDEVIRKYIPSGYNHQQKEFKYDFTKLKCWNKLKRNILRLRYILKKF